MKNRTALILMLCVLGLGESSPLIARAAYVHAGCSEDIYATTQQEDEAKNESDANDYGGAYYDYQQAAVYRANCADETTGRARQWNRFYEASDYFFLAVVSSESTLWKDESNGYKAKAHEIANNLLDENLPAAMRGMVQTIWDYSKPGFGG